MKSRDQTWRIILLALLLILAILLISVRTFQDNEGSALIAHSESTNSQRHTSSSGPRSRGRDEARQGKSGHTKPLRPLEVQSLYSTLGFVTLSKGANHNLVEGSNLEVVRDGSVIANLKVTSVKFDATTADIIPHSVVEGTTIQPGDETRLIE